MLTLNYPRDPRPGSVCQGTIFRANTQRKNDLQKEMNKFNDFIIGDFIDSYRNITLKTFSGYKYVSEHCSHDDNKLILMHDDDILINEINFNIHFVKNLEAQGWIKT